MDAKVEVRNGVYVVNLVGQMNFESADQLRHQCMKTFEAKSVIFNLKGLSFVGSSGITPFLQLLTELAKSHGPRFKICAVGTEFMRLFESSTNTNEGIEIYRDLADAERAFFSTGMEIQAIARIKPFGLQVSIED